MLLVVSTFRFLTCVGLWSIRYHLYFPLKLPETLSNDDDDENEATTAPFHQSACATAAPEVAKPNQSRQPVSRRPHVATCDSRGRARYGWHVDLGKHFGDRGLGGARTLASNDYSAAVVRILPNMRECACYICTRMGVRACDFGGLSSCKSYKSSAKLHAC